MLLGSGHRQKNESWYWLPPPPSVAPSLSHPPTLSCPSIYLSLFMKFIFPVHLVWPSPSSCGHTNLFPCSSEDLSDRIWGELACSRPERCIPTTTWLAQSSSLDARGRRRRGAGGGVLSREATSSLCVESIFSRVNRGIPAHWSWLHSHDCVVGGWRRSAVLLWMWMNDASLQPVCLCCHSLAAREKRCATNRPTSTKSDSSSPSLCLTCMHIRSVSLLWKIYTSHALQWIFYTCETFF